MADLAAAGGGGSTPTPAQPFNPTVTSATPPLPTSNGASGAQPPKTVTPAVAPTGPTSTGNLATVDPRDATYYDTLARLQYQNATTLSGLQNTYTGDEAAYNSGVAAQNQQLPLTLAATRNTANSQGLLESGILAQRAGENEAAYTTRMGNLLAKWQGDQADVTNKQQAAGATLTTGTASDYAAAVARAAKNDLATSPTTPALATPLTGAQKTAENASVRSAAAANVVSGAKTAATSLSRSAAKNVGATTRTAAGAAGRAAAQGVKQAALSKARG